MSEAGCSYFKSHQIQGEDMGKNCISAFEGATTAIAHPKIDKRSLQRLREILGIPSYVSHGDVKAMELTIKGLCGTNGVKVETVKNGHAQDVWVKPWKLHPVIRSAAQEAPAQAAQ